jgi:hypothetical protein
VLGRGARRAAGLRLRLGGGAEGELGAFFVDPIRGFNRFFSGDAMRPANNPVDPMDWRPPGGSTFAATGVRSIGEGSSITHNTKSYATIPLNHEYGNVFDTTRRKPFDFIDFVGHIIAS